MSVIESRKENKHALRQFNYNFANIETLFEESQDMRLIVFI